MKNKLPLIIGAIVVIAGLVYFMGGGDKSAKKSSVRKRISGGNVSRDGLRSGFL